MLANFVNYPFASPSVPLVRSGREDCQQQGMNTSYNKS